MIDRQFNLCTSFPRRREMLIRRSQSGIAASAAMTASVIYFGEKRKWSNTRFLKYVIFIFLLVAAVTTFAQANKSFISLKNPSNYQRDSELIVLSRQQIEHKTGKLLPKEYIKIYKENATPLTVQFDDLDQDGIWDEAIFLYSFKPNEDVRLNIEKSETIMNTDVQPLAHVRMKLKNDNDHFGESVKHVDMPYQNPPTDFSKHALPPYLTEGPGWENDKVAFRLYFDTRNGKDIYGKRIPGMVMDTVGANTKNSYHKLSNWGMDILPVYKSLGAGGLAFSYKLKNGKDTLVRLGGLNVKSESYDEIADGPIRAIFKMDYHWVLNNQPVEIIEYISIWGGQYFYQSKISVKGNDLPEDLKIDMGIPDFYDNESGNFSLDKLKVLYSFGKQSENKDNLGMAVFSNSKDFSKFWSIGKEAEPVSDINQTYLSEEKVTHKNPVVYRFYACWNLTDALFNSENTFIDFLHKEAVNYSNPIIIQ